jgi:sterol 3beta-glucosyltransferase
MRVVILTVGSRGDVQPYVALGGGLRRAGHAVTLATHREFESFIRAHAV